MKLAKLEYKKLKHYRTFWVLTLLYFITLGATTSSGMEFLKWLAAKGANFGDQVDILRIPLYHFPDIWQNLTYVSQYFQLILAIVVIISVTNEFSFKTIRQNIIDGLDRKDFLASKLALTLGLSLAATLFVFLIGLITGSIYSPASEMRFMFSDIEFIPGFWLATFTYLNLVLLLAILIKRAGLSIGLVLILPILEFILAALLPDATDPLIPYLPVHAINAIIKVPFQRYIFMEIQDYIDWLEALVAIMYNGVYIALAYWALCKRDFS